MTLRRTVLLGTVAIIALVVGVGLIVSHNQANSGNAIEARHTNSGPPKLEVTSIKSSLASPTTLTTPNYFACAKTLCLVATSNQSGNLSKLWARRAGQASFTQLPPLSGSAQSIAGLACQSSKTCYAIVDQSPSTIDARLLLLVTNDAGSSWSPLTLGDQFSPTSVGCLLDGPCWVSGTAKGHPEVLAASYRSTQNQPTQWKSIKLANEPAGASNQLACATTSNCVDIVGLPAAMASSEEALRGGLTTGFTTILSAATVEPQDQASCDLTACYFSQAFGQGAGDQIHVTSVSDNGSVATLATSTSPNTFVDKLICSSTQCIVSAQTNSSETSFWTMGRRLAPVSAPNGLSVDSPSLECENTSPICLLTLYRSGLGLAREYLTQPQYTRLQLGSPVQLTTKAKAIGEPFSNQLASCASQSCFEPVETSNGLELLGFQPGHDRVLSSLLVHDASAGLGLLTPIAMTCPSTSSCKLVAEIGNGPYQLLSLNPLNRQTAVAALPRGATPGAIACSSSKDCIVTISGISHHHGFPALWTTDAGKSWHSARAINAANDLSSAGVSCQVNGVCIAIGQHDFVDGDGTLRPFIAYSHDNGKVWRLLRLTGQVPYSLLGPALSEVACSSAARCSGVVATSGATLLLQGDSGMNSWTVRTIHLHKVGQNAYPYSASIACGPVHCLLSLTINPGSNGSKLSVQSLVVGPGRRLNPIVSGQLPSSGDLSAAFGSHHYYLDVSPSSTTWVHLNPT